MNELEETLCCLKHEIKQLKSAPFQEPVVAPAPVEESTPVDLTPVENDIGCLKNVVKPLKETPVVENISPAAVGKRSVETPIDHSDEIELLKNSVNELEEALRCLKSTPAPEPVEQTTPFDLSSI